MRQIYWMLPQYVAIYTCLTQQLTEKMAENDGSWLYKPYLCSIKSKILKNEDYEDFND